MASRFWLSVICVFSLAVSQGRAVSQDAKALATIQETRAGGRKACATGRTFRIAFSHSLSEAAIVKAVRRFADVRAAELGCVTMLHDNTQANNLEQQVDAVQSWVTQGVDAIVVTPIDAQALEPLQLQAQKKGIKWLTYLGKNEPERRLCVIQSFPVRPARRQRGRPVGQGQPRQGSDRARDHADGSPQSCTAMD